MALPSADFSAVFACISFAHDNNASKTGFSCSSRFSYRSSGVSSANACSSLKSREQWHYLGFRARPLIRALLQSLVQQDEAILFPVQALDAVSPPSAEQKQRVGKWIQFKLLLDEPRQTIYAFTQIRVAALSGYQDNAAYPQLFIILINYSTSDSTDKTVKKDEDNVITFCNNGTRRRWFHENLSDRCCSND